MGWETSLIVLIPHIAPPPPNMVTLPYEPGAREGLSEGGLLQIVVLISWHLRFVGVAKQK